MKIAVRIAAVAVIALFAIGLVRQQPWEARPTASLPHVAPTTITASRTETPGSEGGDLNRDITNQTESNQADQIHDDLASDDRRAPQSAMVRALSGVVSQNSDVFGDADSELQDSLAQADKILTDSRTSARQALRNVNRQVRLPGRSPHLLLVSVAGLSTHDLACYDNQSHGSESPTPHCDRLAREGLRATQFFSTNTGDSSGTKRAVHEPLPGSFIETLWNSGYSPALLGDLSAIQSHRVNLPWDQTFGWSSTGRSTKTPFAPFPTNVLSRNQPLGVSQPTDDAPGIAFDQIMLDEAASYTRSVHARRPVALIVATPLAWWLELARHESRSDDDQTLRQQAIARFDHFLGQLHASLAKEVGSNRLITIVAGAASPTTDDSAEGVAAAGEISPLLATWPNRIQPGQVLDKSFRSSDLPATIADMIQSTRRSRGDSGRSMWSDWQ
ncbi:MAG: sulfatase-like hydrolase/transferase [Pirellulales bacterium]